MLNTIRRTPGRLFLLMVVFALLPLTTVGCDSNSSPAGVTSETPKPPPANIDPASGRPRAGGPTTGGPASR